MAVTYLSVDMSPGVQHAVQAGDTIANTVTATDFSTNYTIPANWFTVGRGVHILARGVFGSTGADSLTLDLRFGTTTLATASTATLTNLVTRMWEADFLVICTSTGATGTVEVEGHADFNTTATAAQHCEAKNSAAVTIDTTATQQAQLRITWSVADAANTITMRNFRVEIFGDN